MLQELLESEDPRVRAAAVRVVPQWREALENPVELLSLRVRDENPRVRLEAVRALARFPSTQSAGLALQALDFEMDRFLDHALWLTVDELTGEWFPRVQAGEEVFDGDPKRLLFALEVIDNPSIVEPLVGLLAKNKVEGETRKRALRLVAKFGNADHMRSILDRVLAEGGTDADKANLLAALLEATPSRGVVPSGDLSSLVGLFDSEDSALRGLAVRAAGVWRVESARERISEIAVEGIRPEIRTEAIDALANLGGDPSRDELIQLIDSEGDQSTRVRAAIGLANLDLPLAAEKTAVLLAGMGESDDPSPLFNTFLQRKEGPAALVEALRGQSLPADIAKLGVRLIGGAGRSEPGLLSSLTESGGLSVARTEIAANEMKAILDAVESEGNAARGEELYRSQNLNCLTCHAIAGSGGKVGPDLSTIGASAQDDYLVEALLLPNAKIKEGYHSKTVYTVDEEVFTGVPIRETDTELVLRDQFDEEISIPTSSIESVEEGMSLMPGGLTDLLTHTELADLITFLSALGEEGPYAMNTRSIIRSWEVLMDTPTAKENLRVTGMEPVVHN
ncbi:MAG: HEAT repeat domain-containing protein, partial [Candidatus Omnitrophica bacterium]|nr:HEAT repeat domain-containing protein [Candidatus Omnitrophota bacterium]